MPATRLIHHLRNYASAGLLSAVVGLISFPIMTRNLSVADYGIVGLISISLTLFIAIGKLGMQHAVVRYFAQIKNGNIAYDLKQMNSTVSGVFIILAVVSTSLFLFMGFQVLPGFLQYENISSLFLLASGVVFVRLLGSSIMNFLRAQQRSADVAIAQSLARFLNMLLIISVVLTSVLDPHSVLICLFIAELVGVGFAVYQYRSELYFKRSAVSGPLAKAMLFYGMPLMMLESLSLVLRLSDRYLIEAMLGVNELGQYSASYNLTGYLDIIILAALLQAIRPVYVQMWESSGVARTREFLSRGLHLYAIVGIPFVVMFSVTSPYLLSFLAGPKYALGTVVIPYVALSFWLEGAMIFLAAGLYIFKNTKVLMYSSLAAAVMNVGLNVLLIPHYGIAGAAAVTVFSYAVFVLSVTFSSFKYVKVDIKWKSPLIVSASSAFVFVCLKQVDLGGDATNFLVKGICGSVVLALVVWVLEPQVRTWLQALPARVLRRSAPL